jgi:hypothetical protein
LMQTRCSILPSIADKTKHEVNKQPCRNNACSQHSVMWQTDAMSDLGLPSHLLSPKQLQPIQPRSVIMQKRVKLWLRYQARAQPRD